MRSCRVTEMDLASLADIAVPMSDGSWASAKVARIAELIEQYDPSLEVRWIPRDRRVPGDDAFQIVEHCPNGQVVVAFSVRDESQFDERVLKRIVAADNAITNVQDRMETQNAVLKELEDRRKEDAQAEARSLAAAVFQSPLNRYVHGGRRLDLPGAPDVKQARTFS